MKTDYLLRYLWIAIFVCSLISCSEDEKDNSGLFLSFESSESYVLQPGESNDIPVKSGKRNYDIKIQNEEIASVILSLDGTGYGNLTITGNEWGSTPVEIIDINSQESISFFIYVVNSIEEIEKKFTMIISDYEIKVNISGSDLADEIQNDIKKQILAEKGHVISLNKNDQDNVYMFKSHMDFHLGKPYASGNYTVEFNDGKYYLTISCTGKEKTGIYPLEVTGGNGINMLIDYFNLNTNSLRIDVPIANKIKMRQDLTNYYKKKYSTLESVYIDWSMELWEKNVYH